MTFTDHFADMLTETITVASWAGMSTDGYATTTYSTATTNYACRSVTGQRLVRNFDGVEEMSTMTVSVASTSTFSAMDQFTLAGVSPPLLSIETYRDEYGITHSKLGFGV
jgi:hypothetical protein